MFEIGKVDLSIERQTCDFEPEVDIDRLRKFRMSIARQLKKPFYSLDPKWRFSKTNVKWLVDQYSNKFDIWWHHDMLDIIYHPDNISLLMNIYNGYTLTDYKTYWWKPERINLKVDGYRFMYKSNLNKFEEFYPDCYQDDQVVNNLPGRFGNKFDIWWPLIGEEKQNRLRKEYSWELMSYCTTRIKMWFTEEMNTKKNFNDFVQCCSKYVDLWWKPEYLTPPVINGSLDKLIKYLPHKFPEWFIKDKWNYKRDSIILVLYFPQYFDIWWDSKQFNYMSKIDYKRSWRFSYEYNIRDLLVKMFDIDYIEAQDYLRDYTYARDLLYMTCSDHFDKWWSKKYFKPAAHTFKLLDRHCSKHANKFRNTMYILWKLQNEEVKKNAS